MVVQEVDTANDIGKELYVDIAQDGRFSGELIALQVMGGRSYRRSDTLFGALSLAFGA